jgi:hypothetical protein
MNMYLIVIAFPFLFGNKIFWKIMDWGNLRLRHGTGNFSLKRNKLQEEREDLKRETSTIIIIIFIIIIVRQNYACA